MIVIVSTKTLSARDPDHSARMNPTEMTSNRPPLNTSLRVLRQRRPSLHAIDPDINEHFVMHPSNYELATFTVYTEGRLPEDTCAEIVGRIHSGAGPSPTRHAPAG